MALAPAAARAHRAGSSALGARALYLQGLHNDFLQAKGESRYSRVIALSATRGMIVDRNNEPLAISTPVESVAASPADMRDHAEQTARLARLLEMDAAELQRRLADTKREFVYLKRQLPPEQAAKVVELNIPGVFLQREYRRYYPAGEVMAHLIGFTDIDDNGQEALELAFESTLDRQARQPARDQGPARPHHRGRREHPRSRSTARSSRSRSTRASSTSRSAS